MEQSPLNHRLGTDHTQTQFSNTNLSFIDQEKDTRQLNLNCAEKVSNSFADVILRGKQWRSVLE